MITSLRDEDVLKLTIYWFEVSVPAAFFLAATSLLFLMLVLSFCHLSVVMSLKAGEARRLLIPGFSSNTYGLLQGRTDDVSLGLPGFSNPFIKEVIPVSRIFEVLILLSFITALFPIIAFSLFLAKEQYLLMSISGGFFEVAAVAVGLAVVLLSAIYFVLFHVPLPVQKNIFAIRWSFLVRLSNDSHPRVKN